MRVAFVPLESLPATFEPLLRVWRNYEPVRSQMLNQSPILEDEHRYWYTRVVSPGSSYRVRIAHANDEPFGVIYLTDIDRVSSVASWGMYIGDERFLGRGLGRRMLLDLLEWAFEEEGLERLYTSVLADNSKAVALYLDCGFHFEGRFERHIRRASGEFVDVYWMALFAHEWRRKKGV